ncbi:solute carrier family 35 member F1 isoform X2 [Fukomys damarensis]|uniref:solute carrier family 35 member F1 isoform X2 n=1 Tax=Fukomys damarensis TaxID=885580 RepID=UPI0014550C12|nr:solute carrier family 35 member F1 isoform X2 [Fukomys damarensis]
MRALASHRGDAHLCGPGPGTVPPHLWNWLNQQVPVRRLPRQHTRLPELPQLHPSLLGLHHYSGSPARRRKPACHSTPQMVEVHGPGPHRPGGQLPGGEGVPVHHADQHPGENKLVGDLLVLGGATLYGISNVWEEYIIRTLSRVEFLGMIGLFGAFFSGIQLAIMEHKELLKVPWDWQIGLLYVSFSACMFGLYSFMPVVIKKTSATAVNLSLLTADLYSLFCGLFLFHYKFSGLYLLSFFTILIGLVLYSSTSTYIAQDPRVYKQFRNPAGPAVDLPAAAQVEPSVTYTSLGQETEEEPHVHMA